MTPDVTDRARIANWLERYGPLIVSGHHVAVEWWANLRNGGAPVTLAGEFFLSFAASGLCREL
jgi:hypothetical protein